MELESGEELGRIGLMLSSACFQAKFGLRSFLVLAVLSLTMGCTALNPFAPLPASKTTSANPTGKLHPNKQTFTGKIVLAKEGYRLQLNDSDDLLRLTRAKRGSEFAAEELNLRKYYEKNLAVRASREGDWLWDAEIVGQWVSAGQTRGSNLLAPPVGQQ